MLLCMTLCCRLLSGSICVNVPSAPVPHSLLSVNGPRISVIAGYAAGVSVRTVPFSSWRLPRPAGVVETAVVNDAPPPVGASSNTPLSFLFSMDTKKFAPCQQSLQQWRQIHLNSRAIRSAAECIQCGVIQHCAIVS